MKLFTNNLLIVVSTFALCAATPTPDTEPVLRKICSASCTGGVASITTWHDSTGKIGYYELSGDVGTCPHAPLILLDSRGREALTIPNQPVDPHDKATVENLKQLHQKRKELLNGHTASKPLFCSDIPR
jgi:hypothetical protein